VFSFVAVLSLYVCPFILNFIFFFTFILSFRKVAHSARSDLELLGDDTTQGDLAALRQVCQDMLLDDDSVRPEAFTETILSDSADSSMTDGGNDSSSSASSSSKSSNKKSKGKQAKSGKSTPPAKESKNSKSKMRNSGPLAGLLVLNIASDGTCTVNNAVSGDSGRNDSDDEETSRAPPVQVRRMILSDALFCCVHFFARIIVQSYLSLLLSSFPLLWFRLQPHLFFAYYM